MRHQRVAMAPRHLIGFAIRPKIVDEFLKSLAPSKISRPLFDSQSSTHFLEISTDSNISVSCVSFVRTDELWSQYEKYRENLSILTFTTVPNDSTYDFSVLNSSTTTCVLVSCHASRTNTGTARLREWKSVNNIGENGMENSISHRQQKRRKFSSGT